MKKHWIQTAAFGISLTVVLLAFGPAEAQVPGRSRSPLDALKRALGAAGAPALSAAQEEQLAALTSAHRAALEALRPEDAGTARRDFDAAVLNGDGAAAQAQADLIASTMADLARARLKQNARFQIQVISLLRAGGQLNALQQHLGTSGVSRLLHMLSGGAARGGLRGGAAGPGQRPQGAPPRGGI